MLCKGWNLRVHREFSVSIRWNTMANAFGSSCAYHTRQTQCWAESSQLIRTGREQFLLQEESRATPNTRATLGFFFSFSFGMIINLWQIPQLHAAQSRLTRKKTAQSMEKCSSKIYKVSCVFWIRQLHFIPCSLHFALKVETRRFGICVCEHMCLCSGKCRTGQPWAGPAHFFWEALGSNTSEISLISLTCPSVLLTSKRSPLTEMQVQVSWMFGHLVH